MRLQSKNSRFPQGDSNCRRREFSSSAGNGLSRVTKSKLLTFKWLRTSDRMQAFDEASVSDQIKHFRCDARHDAHAGNDVPGVGQLDPVF